MNVVRRIAKGWLVVGAIGLVLVIGAAVAHYCFGAPVHEGNTDRLATPGEVSMIFGVLTAGFGLFTAMGLALLRWGPKA